ncbi:DUF3429 domain-containing protein [Marinomonas sp.]|uniref:DUF3429 domain-containing protein n=1 Tax=Marinomonas sp. TaxID=1904862 RepID=UPI003BADAEFB
MRSYKPVVATLSILALLPFIFTTYLSLTNSSFMGRSGITLFATYGAIIISFIAGSIWGRVLEQVEHSNGTKLLVFGLITLFASWVSLLLKIPELSVVMLLLSLITIFWVEARWLKQPNDEKKHYATLNFSLTSMISIMHLLVLYPHY